MMKDGSKEGRRERKREPLDMLKERIQCARSKKKSDDPKDTKEVNDRSSKSHSGAENSQSVANLISRILIETRARVCSPDIGRRTVQQ